MIKFVDGRQHARHSAALPHQPRRFRNIGLPEIDRTSAAIVAKLHSLQWGL